MPRLSDPHRKRPVRRARYAVLVVSGGRSTELEYLEGFKRWLVASNRLGSAVQIKEKGGVAPDQVVQAAIDFQARKVGAYDEVWCVVDVDDFQRHGDKIDKAALLARRHDINLAVSNPCFELWLLLHHADCRSYCAGYDDVVVRLRKHVPGYDKSALRFADYAGGVGEAVARARALGDDYAVNPSTGVWRLVETIREKP